MMRKFQMRGMYHEHFVKSFRYSAKNIWLLIFPVLRGIKSFRIDFGTFYTWLSGAWFDLLILMAVIGFGIYRWVTTWVRFGDEEVTLTSGLFVKSETVIPFKSVSVILIESPFYLRPFRTDRIKINTCAGAFKSSDMSLLMRSGDFNIIRNELENLGDNAIKVIEIRPKSLNVLFFSLVFSSSMYGAIYIVLFFFQLGSVSRDLIEHEFRDTLSQLTNEVSSIIAFNIPRKAIYLSVLIGVSWALSFIVNILRYAGFKLEKHSRYFKVSMGAVTLRNYYILSDKINYVDMRQTLLMKLFHRSALNINCAGYGNIKSELPVLVPVINSKTVHDALELLNFRHGKVKRTARANRAAVMTFLGLPLTFLLGIPLLMVLLFHWTPKFADLILPFAFFAEIPAILMTIIKINALLETNVTIEDEFIYLHYTRFFTFHTVVVDRKKLVKLQIIQNPVQKKLGRCRIDFYFSSGVPKKNKLYGMNIKDAKRIENLLSKDIMYHYI